MSTDTDGDDARPDGIQRQIQRAAVPDPGHLLPQETWDEVQRQVAELQETDPAYHPDIKQRAPRDG